ncbi:3D domain-containing protein [Clostridium nigeriense]|uniref:3D domain-containing protein n=1 Tax=Clostridium nigeriense TaxID=1805470 RepID=UPI003D326DB7
MNKRRLLSAIATLLIVMNISTITFADQDSSETQEIQENKVKYEQLDNETLELNSEIAELNNEIESINLKLDKNNSEIENTEIEIENINKKIEDAKIQIEEREATMDKRLRSMYKTNVASSMILYLITSDNLFDLFYRVQAMSKIISIDKEIVSEINTTKSELENDAKTVEEKQDNLNNLKLSIENDLNEVNKKKEEQEAVLADLNSKKDEIMSIIEANEVSLLSHSLSIIDSGSSSISDLKDALSTLNYMLPQLNSDYAISLAEQGVTSANTQIEALEAAAVAAAETINKNETTDNSGSTNGNYLATFSMSATAYTGGEYTAMGLKPTRDPNGLSTVSVDSSVIPLGSKVYVEGYGYAIASDTGGAIQGNKIDLYMNSLEDCTNFGRRTVTVYIVAYPNQW